MQTITQSTAEKRAAARGVIDHQPVASVGQCIIADLSEITRQRDSLRSNLENIINVWTELPCHLRQIANGASNLGPHITAARAALEGSK